MLPIHDPSFSATYEVIGTLGRGGMGEVFHLRHRIWEIELAAKFPLASMVASAGGLEAFRKEAQTWIGLPPHPHVVTCHYIRIFEEIPVIFAEYVAGPSLAGWLHKRGPDAGATGLRLAFEAAHGLWHAHRCGLIHQDIKPSNILVGPDGARLTDFGIAGVGSLPTQPVTAKGTQTRMATVLGMTPHYASPEQLGAPEVQEFLRTVALGEHQRQLTRASDIWSLGCTFLELWTGISDWKPGKAHLRLQNIKTLAPELKALLSGMLQLDPHQRPSLEKVVEALGNALQQRGFLVTEPQAAQLRADGLNNRAVSEMDLGSVVEARQLLKEALEVDPHHPEAVFNAALLDWRQGECTDVDALARVKALKGGWVSALAEAWMQVERGDETAAWAALDRLAEEGVGDPRATRAAARAAKRVRTTVGLQWQLRASSKTLDRMVVERGQALTAGRDGALRLWDLRTKKELQRIVAHQKPDDPWASVILGIARVGERVYSVGWDGFFRGHDLKTGRSLFAHAQPGKLYAVAITADGKRAYTGSGSGSLWSWALEGDEACFEGELLSLPHDLSILALRWHEEMLWVIAEDGKIRRFQGQKLVDEWASESRPVCLRAVPGEGRMAVGERNKRVSFYGGTVCEEVLSGMRSEVGALAFSTLRPWMVCASGYTLALWDLELHRCLRTIELKVLPRALEFLADGQLLVGDWDGNLCCYRLEEATEAPTMLALPRRSGELQADQTAFESALSRALAALQQNNRQEALQIARTLRQNPSFSREERLLRLWESLGGPRGTPRAIWEVARREGIAASARVEATKDWLVLGEPNGAVQLWKGENRIWHHAFGDGDLVARCFCFSPDQLQLAIGCYRAFYVLDLKTLSMQRYETGSGYTEALVFHPEGIVTALDDMGHLMSFDRGVRISVLRGPENRFCGAVIDEKGMLWSADDRGLLQCWRWQEGMGREPGAWSSDRKEPEPPNARISLISTGDGGLCLRRLSGGLTLGMNDGSLMVHGPNLRRWKAHTLGVSDVGAWDDGRLLTVSFDRTARIWEGERCLYTLEGFTHPLWGVALVDPQHFWTTSDDGVARMWYVDWELL